MRRSTREMKGIRRSAVAVVVAPVLAISVACSLFVDTSGLQDGSSDAAKLDDVISASETSTTGDSGIADSGASLDSGADARDAGPSAATISFVQTADFDPLDGGSGDMTLSPVAPGNTILVFVVLTGTATASVSDNKGDAFNGDVFFIDGASDKAYIFSAIRVPGNETNIHVTVGGGTAVNTELYAAEYSGIAAFDVGAGSYSAAGGSVSSGTITTAVANELLVGFGVDGTVTHAADYVARNTANDDVVEDRIAGAPGTYSASATMDGSGFVVIGAYR